MVDMMQEVLERKGEVDVEAALTRTLYSSEA